MKIKTFSKYLNKLEKTDSRNKITEILAELLDKSSAKEVDKLCYLCLGQLKASYQTLKFDIGEKIMIKVLAKTYQKKEKEIESKFKDLGDLGDVAFQLSETKKTKNLTINQVHKKLKQIAQEKGTGSQENKINYFSQLLKQVDKLSSKYIVRIPLGKLRLGFSEITLLDALSWMKKEDKSLRPELEKAYNVVPDIGKIAKILKTKGVKKVKDLEPQIGIPIRPALAERLNTAGEILQKMNQPAVEPKYDGFRVQIHLKESNIDIFSRRMENITKMFPDVIKPLQQLPVKSAIFDGEAIGIDPKTNKFLPFQKTAQRKRKYQIKKKALEIPVHIYLFDLLFYNGKSLLTKTFQQRRKQLEKIFKNVPQNSILKLTPQKKIATPEKLNAFFYQQIKKGLEGLVCKQLNSQYQAGARSYHWVKYKKALKTKLADTLDCLVLGYYRGKGKRAKFGIGAFLSGIFQPEKDQFLTVAKIGTGLTDDQWKTIKNKADKLKSKAKPSQYKLPKELNCDVWINPGLVVEIEADEISKSPLHSSGYALRFPRMKRFRDKSPTDVTKLNEIKKLFNSQ